MILRSGAPKVDLAFYYSEMPYEFAEIYPGLDMIRHGELDENLYCWLD